MTPSGVPPMPNRMSASLWGHAAEIAPATSPSGMRRIRAPASRHSRMMSFVARAVEDHRGDVVDVFAERLGHRLEVRLDRRVEVDGVGGRGAHRDLVHVEARARVEHRAALGDADHRDRVVAPERGEGGALDRVDRDVDLRHRAAPTSSPLKSIGASSFSPSPMTTMPSIDTVLSTRRMASTAAPSAAFLSPRPIHRPAASAAASVTRTSSMARLRSGDLGLGYPSRLLSGGCYPGDRTRPRSRSAERLETRWTNAAAPRARPSGVTARRGSALALHAEAGWRAAPFGPLLEIGTYCGKSAIYLGAAAREAARCCSPSTTIAVPRRTRRGGSITTRGSSTRAPGAWTRCRGSAARSRTRASRTS